MGSFSSFARLLVRVGLGVITSTKMKIGLGLGYILRYCHLFIFFAGFLGYLPHHWFGLAKTSLDFRGVP